MNLWLRVCGVNVVMLPALDFMKTDKNAEPDTAYIEKNLRMLLEKYADADLYLTQGYICRNFYGEVDNLQRGGSDLTASLIGAAVNAEEIEIWTDIDGMHNNDPRFVENTTPVEELHFEEAAELAYFGAKILHPTCVLPAKLNNIPVRLLNTMQPDAKGTLIYNSAPSRTIKVFEIFETYRTPIDMIATSEVGVSVTIDNERDLTRIVDDLKKFGTVTIDHDMVIICVVGDMDWQNMGFEARALDALKDIPVRMISYGGSNFNISFLVRKQDKVAALQALSSHLFKH